MTKITNTVDIPIKLAAIGYFSMLLVFTICFCFIVDTLMSNREISLCETKWLKSFVDTYPQELQPIWKKSLEDGKITGNEMKEIERLIYKTRQRHDYN